MTLYRLVALAALAVSLNVFSTTHGHAAPTGCPSPANDQGALDTVAFPTEQRGWLGGAHAILATTDGGQTWTQQYAGPTTIEQFSFVSNDEGWAMGRGALLHTVDAGKHWVTGHKPPHALQQIDFVTSSRGGAIAGNSPTQMVLYRTNDSGATRTRQALAMPVGAICFSDSAHGWAAKFFSTGKTSVTLITTSDGGSSWHATRGPIESIEIVLQLFL